jgi:hypothetical protein
LGFCADLRRESDRGNLKLGIFDGLGGFPREPIEEGGQLVLLFVCLGVYSPVNVDGWT